MDLLQIFIPVSICQSPWQEILINTDNSTEESHRARSNFVRRLVQRSDGSANSPFINSQKLPKVIVQFWDDLEKLPQDVSDCINTWNRTKEWGIEQILFDKHQARQFISNKLGLRYEQAYDKCYHPAMQSDYFRLCYIFAEGGCYIDVDDVYDGANIRQLFSDSRLKIQPLCYDIAADMMVSPAIFLKPGANSENWVFYFNNNPLIAAKNNPFINHALIQATLYLEKSVTNGLPEIQSTTGPGNLTKSIFDVMTENVEFQQQRVLVLHDWESTAKTIWDLSYRNDSRNWRLSNCQNYQG